MKEEEEQSPEALPSILTERKDVRHLKDSLKLENHLHVLPVRSLLSFSSDEATDKATGLQRSKSAKRRHYTR